MKPIEQIEARLQRHPSARYVVSTDRLRLDAPQDGGFSLSIGKADGAGWTVVFGQGLHCHFADPEQASAFFFFGLSDHCRLREIRRGHTVCRAFAERRAGDSWQMVQETGLLLYPFWRRPSEYIFQNTLLSPGSQE